MWEVSMTTTFQYSDGQNLCNEIGGAVLTVLGSQQPLTVQALIDCMQQAQRDAYDYGECREQGMALAIAILTKFIESE